MKKLTFTHMRIIVFITMCLSLLVVMLGAYTRLTNAGLGCPDWPGCYGHWLVPKSAIETKKAWTEMVHRYLAGTLVISIVLICITLFKNKLLKSIPKSIPIFLILLVVFQAILGMWTVTLKLLPVVVMGHLLGGILIFTTLCYLYINLSSMPRYSLPQSRPWVMLGVLLVFFQIALGGWVSSNYAGIACIGFPRCNGLWFPHLHFAQGFNLLSPVGANYQGGILAPEIRMTIHFIHRMGAMVVTSCVLLLAMLIAKKEKSLRKMALLIIFLVLMQFSLGLLNVLFLLPLKIAVLHNGMAALLFASMVSMYYFVSGERRNA